MKTIYVLSALFICSATVLHAQNVGVGTTTPNANALLHVDLGINASKGFLVTGTYDAAASIPSLGAGSRMMFYPGKAAFRAGRVISTSWDNPYVGFFSTAFGQNTQASGESSTAIGRNSAATGNYATVIGNASTAAGENSFATGLVARTLGLTSISMGHYTDARGDYSIALGYITEAAGEASVSMGANTNSTGYASTAMGNITTASGNASTAMGGSTIASGASSTAMGGSTVASGIGSTSMGAFTKAKGFASTVLGMYNDSILTTNQTNVSAQTPLFIVGNGDDANNRSNAMVVLKTGNIGIGTSAPAEKLHISNGQLRLSRTASYENNVLFNMPSASLASEHEGLKFQVAGIEKAFVGFSSNSLSPSVLRLSGNGINANDLTINSSGMVGIGTNDPQEKLDIRGNAILNASNATLQMQTGGVDKGYVQLSDDDIRIGTYSSNTNGRFIVRTSGENQVIVDGTGTSTAIQLFSSGTQKGTLTTGSSGNISITTLGTDNLVNLNNELYVNATQNRVGIGTSSPDEKLEVLGNTKITGDITLSGRVLGSTSGNINMIAAARGRVNSLGQAGTGSSSNFTPSRTSKGHYRVDSPVITPSSTVLITFYTGNAQMLSSVTTYTGYFTVHVKDGFGGFVDEDAGFHFVVF